MDKRLENCIQELLDCEALELLRCADRNPNDMYVPYMMNDALEYYFILMDCIAFGELKADFPVGTTVEAVQQPQGHALVLRRPDGTILTLQYRECRSVRELYQYHAIGHFWHEGQEQWRQLVYIIGTIYDKLHYIGADACNAAEQQLVPLITFAPFRWWSPIHESLDSFYSDTEEGLLCMEQLARDVEDTEYLVLLEAYRENRAGIEELALALTKPERKALYAHIRSMAAEASGAYPMRDYGTILNTRIAAERARVTELLERNGFTGAYPCFRRENLQIIAAEEHPYTVFGLEYEDFTFRIRFMVSRTASADACPNAGFFEGTGRIIHSLCELEQRIEA